MAAGWVHTKGGSYRVGGRPAGPPAVTDGNASWQPPPIPAGYYNPLRDIEAAEGKRGSQQTITGLQRQRTNAESDYGVNKSLIERKAQDSLKRISESFQRLGGRQEEGANRLGELHGGALLQAAAKRAANQQIANKPVEQAQQDELGRLALNEQRLIGEGGSITEALTNANSNEQAFGEGLDTLKRNEAAGRGYEPPERPWAQEQGGAVRIGGRY